MNKTSIIIYVQDLNNLQSCLWSIKTYTAKKSYDISLVSEIPIDNGEAIEADVYMADGQAVKAINQAIKAAKNEHIVFLYDDVMVASHWLAKLTTVLNTNPACEAVGPVGYNVCVETQLAGECKSYTNIREMAAVAAEYAEKNNGKVIHSLYLNAFCILMRRSTLLEHELNENYISPAMAFPALTIGLVKSGKSCLVAKEVWLHNARGTFNVVSKIDVESFKSEYGFNLFYSTQTRKELLGIGNMKRNGICILDIGCACGGTMMHIKDHNPTAEVYGIELSDAAAEIARNFGQVWQEDMLAIDNEDFINKFDYIIMGDVLEHIVDTDAALDKVYAWLKPGGQLLVSVPNISHISVIGQMLQGKFTYKDAGILDRTHMRFFTYEDIIRIMGLHGFKVVKECYSCPPYDSQLLELKEELLALKSVKVGFRDLDAYQWEFAAEKPML